MQFEERTLCPLFIVFGFRKGSIYWKIIVDMYVNTPVYTYMFHTQIPIAILVFVIAYMLVHMPCMIVVIRDLAQVKPIWAPSNSIAAFRENCRR